MVQLQPRGGQGRAAIVCEGAANSGAVPLDDARGTIGAILDAPLDGPYAAHGLLEHFLGVTVGLEDGTSGFTQVMKVAKLVRNAGQRRGDRLAHRVLAI